jgi:peptide/nickel transport system permease protein
MRKAEVSRHRPRRTIRFVTTLALTVLSALVAGGALAPVLAPHPPGRQYEDGQFLPPLAQRLAVPMGADRGRLRVADRVFDADAATAGPGLLIFEHRGERVEIDAGFVASDRPGELVRFFLGTDGLGRDVFSRLLYGARLSFTIAGLALIMMMTAGLLVGASAAFGGRWVDGLLMRAVDGLLAFPVLFLVMALVAVFQRGIATLVLVLGLTGWMGISRLIRAELLSLRDRDFVLAARGLGLGPLRILFRHMLPHALTPLVIQASFAVAGLISAEAALSFFGLGVQPPHASWGNLIQDGRLWMGTAWWISLFPALCLALTVIALNILGDALRDHFDPQTSRP